MPFWAFPKGEKTAFLQWPEPKPPLRIRKVNFPLENRFFFKISTFSDFPLERPRIFIKKGRFCEKPENFGGVRFSFFFGPPRHFFGPKKHPLHGLLVIILGQKTTDVRQKPCFLTPIQKSPDVAEEFFRPL